MFSGYIFDVEGTLVDSVPQTLSSLQEALEQAGFDIGYATLQLYSGLDGDQTLQIIAPRLAASQRKQILRAHAKIYQTKYFTTSKLLAVSARCSSAYAPRRQGRHRDRLQRPRTEALLVSPEHR